MNSVREVTMTKKQKAQIVFERMEVLFPDAKSELSNWKTPFQFLVCIALSAQTTDKQVNKITKELFKQYSTPKAMSKASQEEVMELVQGVNYYRNKAKYIIQAAQRIEDVFNGEVPKNEKDLISLSGVGRKTAHVFLNDLYQANLGIASDTHVMRVSQRMGLTKEIDPTKVSLALEALYPQDMWYRVNTTFVLYGRYVCKARMKKGESECVLKEYCSYCGKL